MTKDVAPLPCPFCGCTNVALQEGSTFRWRVLECVDCGARCGEVRVQTLGEGTPAEWDVKAAADAIAKWNKRAAAEPSGERCALVCPDSRPCELEPGHPGPHMTSRLIRQPVKTDEPSAECRHPEKDLAYDIHGVPYCRLCNEDNP